MQASPEPSSSSPFATSALDSHDTPLPGLWRLTWPLFISLALSLSLNFSDAFFLSRISDAAAGAAGAINPLLGATLVLFSAVGQAGASVAGRLFGARRHAELPATYLALLGFNLTTGLVVSAGLCLLHPYLPGWLGLRGQSAQFGQAYLGVLGSFQVLKAVQLAYANMLNSRGETRWILVEAIATNVTNITLNSAILSRKCSFLPAPSVTAVATCTVISLAFGMLFTIAVVHLRLGVRFPVRTSLRELRQRLRPILKIGLPSATEPIAYQTAQIVVNMMVITFGASALAARTYMISFITISTILWSFALGVGTQILVAHRIGAGHFEEANRGLHRALGLAIGGNLLIALSLAAFHRPLLGLLTHDPEVLRIASPLFGIAIIVEMGRAVNIVAGGALRSTGDARFVAIVGSSMMWGVGVLSAYVFGSFFGLGLTGVWIAMALDETTRGFVNYRRWRAGHWRALSALAPASQR
ncbi:MAG TPA: MATE family efflux transporter [Polyangiaceae bacterium]|jgi:putative MATE family efflux protein|nr:MATE family efflux transporter [Polyangiaceae bacterium]